jgi:hypothetical protein
MHPYLEVDLLVLKAGILHCIRCLSLDVSDIVTLSNHFYKTKAPLYERWMSCSVESPDFVSHERLPSGTSDIMLCYLFTKLRILV